VVSIHDRDSIYDEDILIEMSTNKNDMEFFDSLIILDNALYWELDRELDKKLSVELKRVCTEIFDGLPNNLNIELYKEIEQRIRHVAGYL